MKAEDAKPGTISTLADLPKNVKVISEAAGKMKDDARASARA